MTIKECYDILGVSPQASQEEVKKAYKKKAFETHPDKNNGNEEEFKKINQAYSFISGKGNIPAENFNPGFSFNFDDIFSNPFFTNFKPKPNKPPSTDKDIGFDFHLSLDDIKSEKQFTAIYNRSVNCIPCHGIGGKSKNECASCNGRGIKTESRQMGAMFFTNSGPCDVCSGTGEVIVEVCSKCNGQGFSVVQEKVTFHLKKD